MKITKVKEELFQITLSEEEVETMEQYTPSMEDAGIEIYAGENILEKDTLWLFLCELNAIRYHSTISLDVTETLKTLLYPQE